MRAYEDRLKKSYQNIAGVDEVGRGCIFGPVVACCVVLNDDFFHELIIDSKKLSKKKREQAYDIILANSKQINVSMVDHTVIDEINILEASKLAMKNAIEQTDTDCVLIDAVKLDLEMYSESIIKGDSLSISIAAASIIAKVLRDQYIDDLSHNLRDYDLSNNKGYPTKKHLELLNLNGVSKYHRLSFAPVAKLKE